MSSYYDLLPAIGSLHINPTIHSYGVPRSYHHSSDDSDSGGGEKTSSRTYHTPLNYDSYLADDTPFVPRRSTSLTPTHVETNPSNRSFVASEQPLVLSPVGPSHAPEMKAFSPNHVRIIHTRRSSTPIRSNTVQSHCFSSSTNGRAVAPTSLTRATQRLRPQIMDLHGSNTLFPAMRRAHRRFPMWYRHDPYPPTPSRSQDRGLHQVIIAKVYHHLPTDFTQAHL